MKRSQAIAALNDSHSAEPDQLAVLREIDALLRDARIRYWLHGGWALDFLLGRVTREHGDIDLVTWLRHERRVKRLFEAVGFVEAGVKPGTQLEFERDGDEVSVLLVLRRHGLIWTGGYTAPDDVPNWPEKEMGSRFYELAGFRCRIVWAAGQLLEKEQSHLWLGRPPRPKDIEAMSILRGLLAAGAPPTETEHS